MNDLNRFLQHLFSDRPGYVSVCTNDFQGRRTKKFEEGKLWPFPITISDIARKIDEAGADGFDAYLCAHGLRDRQRGRLKPNAAPIWCLWADLDGAPIPTGPLAPTMVVETSLGRWQVFYALARPLDPQVAEALSHRLTDAIGADAGGWMLTKLVRPAGSISYKHGTPFTVRIAHLDPDRKIDPNDLDRILPQVKEAARPSASANINPDDEPPIILSPTAMAVWLGQRPAMKKHEPGVIDRSDSLYKIACVLWEHCATRRTIVAALAERDMSLGWNRYTDRPDEYERIADKVSGKLRLFGPLGASASADNNTSRSNFAGHDSDGDTCDIRLARTITELDQVRAQRDDLQQTVNFLLVRIKIADQRLATYQNNDLGSAKAVASGLIQIFAAETPTKPDTDTGYRVPLGKLADITGLSEDACSRQIKQLAKYRLPDSETPVIHYNVASVGGLDRETGEIIAPHKEMWVGPGVAARDFGQVISTLNPAAKPKWGGVTDRGTCADHPNDGVIERIRYQKIVSYECSVCNHVLQESTSPVASKRSTAKHLTRIPTPHDAAQQEDTDLDFAPMPQDANSINPTPPPTVASSYPGKMRHRAEPETRPLFPVPTADEQSAALASWSREMKPTPLDQFTDIAQGAKP